MRKEPFTVGSFVHVIKRGARGEHIVRDDHDRRRFLRLLRYLNDANVPRNWERDIANEHVSGGYLRPKTWPDPAPYVSVLAFCLLDNHFHLLVRENVENGISKFMQRLCTSMSANFNARHGERGTLFQGAYRARTADTDVYLQYVSAYIQVKNVFELYPGGLERAIINFNSAFKWASEYEFASLLDHAAPERRELIDHKLVREVMPEIGRLQRFSHDMILGRSTVPVDELRALLE